MATRIQVRRDTTTNWTTVNPTLAEGEIGCDLTTTQIKVGNGTDAWNDLPYTAGDGALWTETSGVVAPVSANAKVRANAATVAGDDALTLVTKGYLESLDVTVSDAAPSGAVQGQLWWNTDVGRMFIYYVDADSTEQWVETTPSQNFLYWERTGTAVHPATSTDSVFVGASGGSGEIELNADGTSQFSGDMTFVDNTGATTVNIESQTGDATFAGEVTGTSFNAITSDLTIHVDTAGNDTTGDGTSSAPYASPHRALVYLENFHIMPDVEVTILCANGTYTFTESINAVHPQGQRITIRGESVNESADYDPTQPFWPDNAAHDPANASAKPYRNLIGDSGFDPDDSTTHTTGRRGSSAAYLAYNDTLNNAFYNTVFQFNGCDGIVCRGASGIAFDYVYIRGNNQEAIDADDGSDAGAFGILCGFETSSGQKGVSTSITLGLYVAISNFANKGIQTNFGGNVFCNFVAITNCPFAIYTSYGGNVRAESVFIGNCNNGIQVQGNGNIFAARSTVYNCGSNAFYADGGFINADNASIRNVGAGVRADRGSTISSNNSYILTGGANGFLAIHGGYCSARTSISTNSTVGFRAQENGSIDCTSSNASEGDYGVLCVHGGNVLTQNTAAFNNTNADFDASFGSYMRIDDNSIARSTTANGGVAPTVTPAPDVISRKGALIANASTGVNTIGISFGSPTGNVTSNTLDDYEEGTWPANLTGFGVPQPGISGTGYYTKVGNQVLVQVIFNAQAGTRPTSSFTITGLPFQANSAFVGTFANGNMTNNGQELSTTCVTAQNSTTVTCGRFSDDIGSTGNFYILTISYCTDS